MNININFNEDEDPNSEDDEEEQPEQSTNLPRKPEKKKSVISYDFWDRHFAGKDEATWTDFKKKFEADYKEKVTRMYSQERLKTFLNLIYKDIFNLNKSITRAQYERFCGGNPDADPHRFYRRLEEYAVGYHAMREVFNMDSSLRLTTIQKLGNTCIMILSLLAWIIHNIATNIASMRTCQLFSVVVTSSEEVCNFGHRSNLT